MPRPVVFMGTPNAAVVVLDALVAAGHPIPLVVSRPDRRRGRGGGLTASPVKSRAAALGLEVVDDLEEIARRKFPDDTVAVVVAYGRIIPARLLAVMPMVNVHFSLLPRWRGAAPVERAILAGDTTTGVCVMELEAGLDTGPVLARAEMETRDFDTPELTDMLAHAGAALLCDALARPLTGAIAQVGEPTYASKIEAHELAIDWSRPGEEVLRLIRAVPAHTFLAGARVRILRAEHAPGTAECGVLDGDCTVGTGTTRVRLLRVKPESRGDMDAQAWLRGLKTTLPVRLG